MKKITRAHVALVVLAVFILLMIIGRFVVFAPR